MTTSKIVFMGTPEFAEKALEAIYNAGHEICLVVTQPDRPKGRGMSMLPSEVKSFALEKEIEVFQPLSFKDEYAVQKIREQEADYIIVAAYGRILPPSVLSAAKKGCINIHASLLPHLRGAAPINRAIMAGDKVGGITIMHMAEGLDTGDIISKHPMEIPFEMTAGEYHDALAVLGGEAIVAFLADDAHERTPQNEAEASYAKKIEKSETETNFDDTALNIYNKIRGLSPYPAAFAFIGGRRIKLLRAVIGKAESLGEGALPGQILNADSNGIEISCRVGSIIIKELQPEGKRAMSADEFLRGNPMLKYMRI